VEQELEKIFPTAEPGTLLVKSFIRNLLQLRYTTNITER
jgi:hypothetical protein